MLQNYLKTAFRSLFKNKLYFFLNLFGLVIGMTGSMLLFFYVQHEKSYDRFHRNGDHIYRILQHFRNGDSYTTTSLTPYKFAPLLAEYAPQVKSYVRVDGAIGTRLVSYRDVKFRESRLTFVDTTFFDVFSFPMLKGNPQTALIEPNTVVITDEVAAKFFGAEDPLGKMLTFGNTFDSSSFEARVTGVFRMPPNSHFHKDFLISMKTGDKVTPGKIDSWGWTSQYAYLLLQENARPGELEPAFQAVVKDHAPEWFPEWAYFTLQPLYAVHLQSGDIKDEMEAQGDANYVRIFSIVLVFILLIASINYMNLATARSIGRAKEVGLRKIVGANRRQLALQFLAEAVLLSLLAFVITSGLLQFSSPLFVWLTGSPLETGLLGRPFLLASFFGVAIVIGLLSGSYPAFVISGFRPLRALSNTFSNVKLDGQSLLLRKGLVVFQFAISILLIVGTLVIYEQWQFLQHKKLGVAADQVITIPVVSQKTIDIFPTLKEEWLKQPGVEGVTAATKSFTNVHGNYNTFFYQEEKHTYPTIGVAEGFFETFGVPLLAGRSFMSGRAADTSCVILNRSGWESLGKDGVLGSSLYFGAGDTQTPYQVIGIVEDFHFEPLYKKINPVAFFLTKGNFDEMAVKLNAGNPSPSALAALGSVWESFGLEEPFNFQFLDDHVQGLYQKEALFFKVFSLFAGLAIFIACLGLFGLASYTAQRRTKEIGIRKVVGASISDVIYLLNKDLIPLLGLAFLVATPLAWWMMKKWLENFAYSTTIGIGVFLLAGGLLALLAFVTVSRQSIRAARTNPVKALRNE